MLLFFTSEIRCGSLIIKRKFNQWWSRLLSISTKRINRRSPHCMQKTMTYDLGNLGPVKFTGNIKRSNHRNWLFSYRPLELSWMYIQTCPPVYSIKGRLIVVF